MERPEIREVLDFAVEAAQLAGARTLGWFQANPPVELKADRSPVTAADKAAEELIRARIERAFPDDGIVGEEHGTKEGRSAGRWIIDPIDGTFSFVCGVPIYAVLVAYEWAGEPVAGVIHMPALQETVYAGTGLGCRWNGRVARVSDVSRLEEARVVYAGASWFERTGQGPALGRLLARCHKDRGGWCDAYGYALVATGRAEISLDPVMNVWDTAALAPVLREAGGTLTDWAGRATHTDPTALGTNGHLLAATVATLAEPPTG